MCYRTENYANRLLHIDLIGRKVLSILCEFLPQDDAAKDSALVHPCQETITTKAGKGCTLKSVKRRVKSLEEDGYFTTSRKKGYSKFTPSQNYYTINWRRIQNEGMAYQLFHSPSNTPFSDTLEQRLKDRGFDYLGFLKVSAEGGKGTQRHFSKGTDRPPIEIETVTIKVSSKEVTNLETVHN